MAASDKIPEENRADVIRVVEYVNATLPSPPERHLIYLFDVYNSYLSPHSNLKMSCKNARSTVVKALSVCVKIWKQQEATSQK